MPTEKLLQKLARFVEESEWSGKANGAWLIAIPTKREEQSFVEDAASFGIVKADARYDVLRGLLLDPHQGGFTEEYVEEFRTRMYVRKAPQQ